MVKFWEIKLQNHSKEELLKKINNQLKKNIFNKPMMVVTLNPELLMLADKDNAYREILNKAEIKNIDGFGIKLMTWLKNKKISERFAGADLALTILKQSIKKKLKIAFVFNKNGLSNLTDLQKFSNNFKADIKCIEYDIDEKNANIKINDEIESREVVFVGLGAPYQEKFIYKNKDKWVNLKVAIGVGGTFDFWTGKQKRAPKLMRKIGLEWLWRLITRPKRIWKIWKSTGLFMVKSLIKY